MTTIYHLHFHAPVPIADLIGVLSLSQDVSTLKAKVTLMDQTTIDKLAEQTEAIRTLTLSVQANTASDAAAAANEQALKASVDALAAQVAAGTVTAADVQALNAQIDAGTVAVRAARDAVLASTAVLDAATAANTPPQAAAPV